MAIEAPGRRAAPGAVLDRLAPAATTAPTAPGQSGPRRTWLSPWRVVVLAAVGVGGAERWWVAAHPLGTLTSDGAVIGLMATDLLHHGQLPAYFWGQAYGGSLEAVATAVVFLVAGIGTSQLVAASVLSGALAVVAMWRAGRLIVGRRAAAVGALLFWVWPVSFIWKSVKPGGTYMIGLAASWFAVEQLLRLCQGNRRWWRIALGGVSIGVALWSSPFAVQLLLPAVVWVFPALWRLGRRVTLLVAGAAVGAIPVIGFGAAHGWSNLRLPGGSGALNGMSSRFVQFFTIELPITLSLRLESSLAWVGGAVGMALTVVIGLGLLAVCAAVVCGRARRCRLPVLTIVLLPVLYAANQQADTIGQGRYVFFGASMGMLLAGVLLDRLGTVMAGWRRLRNRVPGALCSPTVVATLGLVLAAASGCLALAHEPQMQMVGFPAPDVPMPVNTAPLLRALASHRVTDAYANYWIAYRVTFETQSRTLVSPVYFDRYPPMAAQVAASARPAYIFVSESKTLPNFDDWCSAHGVAVTQWRAGAFTVVQPASRVLPSEVGAQLLQLS